MRLSDTSVVIVPVRSENYIGWKNQCWVYDNCMLKEVFKDLNDGIMSRLNWRMNLLVYDISRGISDGMII